MTHAQLTKSQGLHAAIAYSYADAAARIGATYAASDVGKVAFQEDNSTYWVLRSFTPPSTTVWDQLLSGNVSLVSFTYADTAARVGSSHGSSDIGKLAYQTDTATYWLLGVSLNWLQVSIGTFPLLSFTYADATARTASTHGAEDIGKLAYQSSDATYWIIGYFVPPAAVVWLQIPTGSGGGGGSPLQWIPLVSGVQGAGTTYERVGALAALDFDVLSGEGANTINLRTCLEIPASSTAQVRLYDATNHATLYESSVISGPQMNYDVGPQEITPPTGAAVLEFWLSTPTSAGGSTICVSAGLEVILPT